MNKVTVTYYNVENKHMNYAGEIMWSNMIRHDKITDLAEAEAILEKQKADWTNYLSSEIKKAKDQETVDHLLRQINNNEWRIVEDVKVFTHVSMYGYSDVHAYEIVKAVSEKTLEIRKMSAKHDISHLEQVSGGFCGHVVNQRNQQVSYESNPTAPVIRIRRKKNNSEAWTSNGQRFGLTEAPYAFYDYNF
mgnify:CR=1 FL=1|jgi:hypothetical protein